MVQNNRFEGTIYLEDAIRIKNALDDAIKKATGPIDCVIGGDYGITSWDFRSTEMIEHRYVGSSSDNASDYSSAYTRNQIKFDV